MNKLSEIRNSEIDVVSSSGVIPTRNDILRLQEAMIPIQTEQPIPSHWFAPGMYLRELTVPAGMLIVGKTHRHAHFLLVLQGRAEVVSEFGREIVTAGYIAISQPGVKRVVLAIEDTKFVTIHHNPTDTDDLYEIESAHIEPENMKMQFEEMEQLS